LKSILIHGLLGRDKLDQYNFQGYRANDEMRLDDQRGAVCISVTFPNYKMFFKYRNITGKDDKNQWVVICLSESLLWELECKFYSTNAASNDAKESELNGSRKSVYDFKEMFGNLPDKSRKYLGIPDDYTTDPQAEILVLEPIPVKYIKSVDFFDEHTSNLWLATNEDYNKIPGLKFYYSDRFFKPRDDYSYWKRKNPFSFNNPFSSN
jgi:hypothetical protein